MTSGLQPRENALRLAEKALCMKISLQACRDHVEYERETYRRRLKVINEANERRKLEHSSNLDVTDADIARIEQFEGLMGSDLDVQLDRMFGGVDAGFVAVEAVDGKTLAASDLRGLLERSDRPRAVEYGIDTIINIALWQAYALLECNAADDAGIVPDADDLVRDRLGLPRRSAVVKK